ncbi:hypothetical protein M407DRAFT_90531 [Tulasnella calospora MUT 4182]|uniref:Uncharacterized protein n=1 Tax=Tulasnella calospora MUT 4182 TaxID=1051891 RepID=A0A0C3LG31_9AGAM|nr:hypothetical protein M407DRAFT_90531 [Tulasnella calospora MUT 4182]
MSQCWCRKLVRFTHRARYPLISAAGAARNLLHVYDGKKPPKDKGAEELPETVNAEQRTSKQLVIISAAREGELARTVRPNSTSSSEFGRLTWYMLHWLTKHPHAEAQNLSERLEHVCVDMAKKQGMPEQHPAILARHPLEGPFEILPGLYMLHQDQDESSVMEYSERAFPIIPWFRPPRLSSGPWTGYRIPRRRAAAH